MDRNAAIALLKTKQTVNALRDSLFDRQLVVIDDPARRRVVRCTRRAGKTSIWDHYAYIVALKKPGSMIRLWADTRERIKDYLWDKLIALATKHNINITPNATELNIKLANGSVIKLVGADTEKAISRKKGNKTDLEVIIEAQRFFDLERVIDDVIEPSQIDNLGTIILEGTPGEVCAGYWFNVSSGVEGVARWVSPGVDITNDEGEVLRMGAGWSCHHWSMVDNPHLPHAAAEREEIRKSHGWTNETPRYVREYLGRWVADNTTLFYHFEHARNTYNPTKIKPYGLGWKHSLGWDIGYTDDMALVVWGWHEQYNVLFEVASWKKPRILSDEVMSKITEWESKYSLNIIYKVADKGGGGLLYVEEINARFADNFQPAQKHSKKEFVSLMNEQLELGRIKLVPGSPLALEMSTLPKVLTSNSNKLPDEDPNFANHCTDAALYAYREARPYLDYRPEVRETPEQAMRRQHNEMVANQTAKEWWEQDMPMGSSDPLDELFNTDDDWN